MRIVRGLAAVIGILAIVAGIPFALLTFTGNPLSQLAGLDWVELVTAPASSSILVGLLAGAGWLLWAVLTICLVVEGVNAARTIQRRPLPPITLPGLGLGQAAAAGLVLAVVAMLATSPAPATADNTPTPAPTTPSASAPTAPADTRDQDRTEKQAENQAEEVRHVVAAGDFLWSLAERYYDGDGAQWRQIADANPHVDPDNLQIGQRLTIPGAMALTEPGGLTWRVSAGDNLSEIADQVLDDPERWGEIWQLNRDQLHHPDALEIGQVLLLPTDVGGRSGSTSNDDGQRQQRPAEDRRTQQENRTQQPGAERGDQAPTEHAPDTTPTQPVPAPAPAPTVQAPNPTPAPPAGNPTSLPTAPDQDVAAQEAAWVAPSSVGLLLAAGLVSTLAVRRRRQVSARCPGQALPTASAPARHTEDDLHRTSTAAGHTIDTLDHTLRYIAHHSRQHQQTQPDLAAARIADDVIHLLLTRPLPDTWDVPDGIEITGDRSVLAIHQPPAAHTNDTDTAAAPFPALVTLGRDPADAHILINLESAGVLIADSPDPRHATALLRSLALELTMSPWATDLAVTFVGADCAQLAAVLDHPAVSHVATTAQALTGLERLAEQRHPHAEATLTERRLDPQTSDAWATAVVVFGDRLDDTETSRLDDLLSRTPGLAIAAVAAGGDLSTGVRLALAADGQLQVSPHSWNLTPTLVEDDRYAHILELLATTGTTDTVPAPWWDHTLDLTTIEPDRVTELDTAAVALDRNDTAADELELDDDKQANEPVGERPGRRRRGQLGTGLGLDLSNGPAGDGSIAGTLAPAPAVPTLQILGPVTIVAADGEPARRNPGRAMELMWCLLARPGQSSADLAERLFLSRSTITTVANYLRGWLGETTDGPWFPPAVGRSGYRLRDGVTSDWDRVQRLIGHGVNTAATEALAQALAAVHGAPFTGAADWKGDIEAARVRIIATITDIAHELATRCLNTSDLTGARWALAQGLLVDPNSELLRTAMIRVEHRAGNRAEVDRQCALVDAYARELGVDLTPGTIQTLQEVTR